MNGDKNSESVQLGQVVLGSFRLERVLGEGGFATAFLAKQLGTERSAVVKVASRSLITGEHGSIYRQSFENELRTATRVAHPNLVTIYTAGYIGDTPAIAMEYVPGRLLGDILEEDAPLPVDRLASVFSGLADALAALHREGITHHDISPDNVMITVEPDHCWKATLLDFGIAHMEGLERLTDGIMGTPPYIAPEAFSGAYSTKSDMFSFGALLWWALTGSAFLEGVEAPVQLYKLGAMMEAEDPRRLRNDLPLQVVDICRELLDPDPGARCSAAEFAARWRIIATRWSNFIAGDAIVAPLPPTTTMPPLPPLPRLPSHQAANPTRSPVASTPRSPASRPPRSRFSSAYPSSAERKRSTPAPFSTAPAAEATRSQLVNYSKTPKPRQSNRRKRVRSAVTVDRSVITRADLIRKSLEELQDSSEDVTAAALVGGDGKVLASFLDHGGEPESLSGLTVAMVGMGERLSKVLLHSAMSELLIQTGMGFVFLSLVGGSEILISLTTANAKLGLVFHETRRAVAALEKTT